jgi:TonB family protein
MMKQTISSPIRKLKLLLVLPLIAGVFYAFSAPEYKFVQASSNSETQSQTNDGKTVTGKVVNQDGKPLKGANIVVFGKTIGTITDANGIFKLVMPDDSPIVISYVGFDSQKVSPDFNKEMMISMKSKTFSIDLENKTSETRKEKPIDIKNSNSLIIVDGKEISKYESSRINPESIESISVLKGESATKLYGEKGKEGVVLITMKKEQVSETITQTIYTKSTFIKLKPNSTDSVLNFKTNSLIYINDKLSTKADVDQLERSQIDNINILKDQSAIALYGEKGKNGVILIKLKKVDQNSASVHLKTDSPLKFENSGEPGKQPLIVKDGVVLDGMIGNNIPPESIESIDVLKGESATKMFGDKGKNGVILITSKKESSTPSTGTTEVKIIGYGNNQNENRGTTGFQIRGTNAKPLVVVDGVISENQDLSKIDPETIESINVIKNEDATKKYGEKAKDGVVEITLKKKEAPFTVVEALPEYPGGTEALNSFVYLTMKYPAIALENGIYGQVYIKFVVTKTGKVTNAKISRGVDPSLNKEALRIVNSMPNWNPGKQNGENVEVAYELPINFKIPADYHPISQEKLRSNTTSKIGNISWVNNSVFSSAELDKMLRLQKGDQYSKELINRRIWTDLDGVSSNYLDKGYAFSNIETSENPTNDGTINLTFTIYEGKRAKIGKIDIKGNKSVSTKEILSKIVIKPGDLFNKTKIVQSVEAISKMGMFDTEEIKPAVIPNSQNSSEEFGSIDLVFNVKEI